MKLWFLLLKVMTGSSSSQLDVMITDPSRIASEYRSSLTESNFRNAESEICIELEKKNGKNLRKFNAILSAVKEHVSKLVSSVIPGADLNPAPDTDFAEHVENLKDVSHQMQEALEADTMRDATETQEKVAKIINGELPLRDANIENLTSSDMLPEAVAKFLDRHQLSWVHQVLDRSTYLKTYLGKVRDFLTLEFRGVSSHFFSCPSVFANSRKLKPITRNDGKHDQHCLDSMETTSSLHISEIIEKNKISKRLAYRKELRKRAFDLQVELASFANQIDMNINEMTWISESSGSLGVTHEIAALLHDSLEHVSLDGESERMREKLLRLNQLRASLRIEKDFFSINDTDHPGACFSKSLAFEDLGETFLKDCNLLR
jgi:hypothetical protein